ncbi:MAG TPA: hypothetical protein VKG44_00565 [Candidatus Baltobacteraceae bacterium]|nr:hypothetical protein [Candidatus Baltobacteraceae bacterium]
MDDAREAAASAGLRYVSDAQPGIRRVRRGRHFSYVDTRDGKPVRDAAELARIRSLAIPPAYEDVWICPSAIGHMQATGRDARGRKQYRYHKRWAEIRDESKFERMLAFAEGLPETRRRVEEDLALPGIPPRKMLATAVRLLEATSIRIGNGEYARANDSFGITTLREEHVAIRGSNLRFRFRGKSGKEHRIEVTDRRLARIVQRMNDLPGQDLFSYVDDDEQLHSIGSGDVNEYIREIAGGDFTAKDFRTWIGTVGCAEALIAAGSARTVKERKAKAAAAVEVVARRLGNTPAVCRKAYIHPRILEAYLDGTLFRDAHGRRDSRPKDVEAFVIAFLSRPASGTRTLVRELRRSVRRVRARSNGSQTAA